MCLNLIGELEHHSRDVWVLFMFLRVLASTTNIIVFEVMQWRIWVESAYFDPLQQYLLEKNIHVSF